jgi:hypothetical protein
MMSTLWPWSLLLYLFWSVIVACEVFGYNLVFNQGGDDEYINTELSDLDYH